MPINIFICYTRKDEALLNELKSHLEPLRQEGLIHVWYDRDIGIGTEWEPQIMRHLNTAQVVLLLVSPDFMASKYCYGIEMKRALERHELGQARVIPIILRPVFWHGKPLGKLQALPTDGKPVTSAFWQDRDAAFYDITQGIYQVVKRLMPPAPLPVQKLAVLRTLIGHTDEVWSVAISADGKTLVSGSKDQTIKVWELSTGKEMWTLRGHTDNAHSIAISADGQTLVSGSWDETIKVWELSTGKEMRTLRGHIHHVTSVAISADGQTLVSGSWDRTIKVWGS